MLTVESRWWIYGYTLHNAFNFSGCLKFFKIKHWNLYGLCDTCKIPFGGSGCGGEIVSKK